MVQLADAFQISLQLPVIVQPLTDHRYLCRGKADLLGAAARITDGQNPHRVAFAAGADRTAGGMTDSAMEQGAAEDYGGGGQSGGEFGAGLQDRFLIHL